MASPDAFWQVPFQPSSAPSAGPNEPIVVTIEDDNVIQFPKAVTSHVTYGDDGSVTVDLSEGVERDRGDSKFSSNMADEMDDLDLGTIAEDLLEGIEADIQSRQEWLENRDRAIDFLGLKIEPPRTGPGGGGAPLQGMSTVKHPALLEAVIRGQANAIGEFLPAEGPVKIEDLGDLDNDELAQLLEKDVNYYLTQVATEYYPDTKQMLAWVYFGGSGFKKVYHCPLRRRPVSESVDAKDLVVSNTATDLENSGRVTHIIEYRKSQLKRMIVAGFYRDVVDPAPTPLDKDRLTQKIESVGGVKSDNMRPEDVPYTVYECRCELEIDWDPFIPKQFKNKGIPLPYSVSIEKNSRRIVSIYRDWKQDNEEATRKATYVKYSYIEWMGFYSIGLLHVMGNLAMALTAMLRIAIDNGMFGNFPGGLSAKSPGAKQATNQMAIAPGEFAQIDLGSLDDIRKVVMPLPYSDVKAGFLQMIEKVTELAKSLGGTADMPVAEGRADIPVGTILAIIEQATKVESAVHKGMHSSASQEYKLLLDALRENPEAIYRHLVKRRRAGGFSSWNIDKLRQALNDYDFVPRSDPNTPSHIHRLMKAVAKLQMAQSAPPGVFNMHEIYANCLEILGDKDTSRFLLPQPPAGAPPPPPSPQEIAARAKMIDAQTKATTATGTLQNKSKELDIKAAQQKSDEGIANTKLAAELVIHAHDAEKERAELGLKVARDNKEMGLKTEAHQLNLHSHALDAASAAHDAAMDMHGINNPEPAGAE
jgi:hypothetical protein